MGSSHDFLSTFESLFTYLETLLAVTGSVHLGLRLLVNWPPLSQPFPQFLPPPKSQNPGYYAPHYDDLKNPASLVRNTNMVFSFININQTELAKTLTVTYFYSAYTNIFQGTAPLAVSKNLTIRNMNLRDFHINLAFRFIILWYISGVKSENVSNHTRI